jgi:hypothetical protein
MTVADLRGLLGVREFEIPGQLIDETLNRLSEAGRHGHEAFVVWGGRLEQGGNRLRFTIAVSPPQTPISTDEGLLVVVDGSALFEVNRTMYKNGAILAGQVHSHPTEAYHSDTDDHFPLVTLVGALSLVIPDFARGGLASYERWAWYRLASYGKWSPLDAETRVFIR